MTKHGVKACLIENPRSGGGGVDLSDALSVLRANDWDVDVRLKLHKGYATKLAKDAVAEGFDVIVACGGDGTVSEIVDGVAGSEVAVGTIPTGTENVWSREIEVSPRMRVAAMQLIGAERLKVDVGLVRINEKFSQHFLLMGGLGFDGAVMARVSRAVKNRIGPLAVGLAAVEALPAFRTFPLRAQIDDAYWQGSVMQLVVGNTRRYGGFTRVTPDALMDDGMLDICFITPDGGLGAGRQALSLLLRQRPSAASSEMYRAKRLTVRSPSVMPLQLDGGAIDQNDIEPGDEGVVYEFSIVPLGVTVLVPRTYDGELLQFGALHAAETSLNGKKHRHKGKKNKKG